MDAATPIRSTNPKFNVPGGVTPVPNWIFDHPNLSVNEKLVLWGYHRSAFATSTTTKTSEAHLAKTTGLNRKTVKDATIRLRERGLIVPSAEYRKGFAQQYELALSPPKVEDALHESPQNSGMHSTGTTPVSGGCVVQVQGDVQYRYTIKKQKELTEENAPASPSLIESEFSSAEGSAPVTSGKGNVGSADCSASSVAQKVAPLDSDDLDAEFDKLFAPNEQTGVPIDEAFASWDTAPTAAWDDFAEPTAVPKAKLDKRLVNTALLTPEGRQCGDDYDYTDLQCDAYETISTVRGQWFNRSQDLDHLVNLRGVDYVAFWVRWLPRKIAAEYEHGRPVVKPTALLKRAIEGKWDVNPDWPEFREELHTWKAAEWLRHVEQQKNREQKSAISDEELDAIPF